MSGIGRAGSISGQGGFTFWTVVLNGTLLAVVLILILRVAPNYMTYMTVRDVVNRAAAEFDPREETLQDLRIKIGKLMRTSQVYAVTVDDMEIYREKGTVIIDATYEARFPIFWIIDGVMTFDDLVIEAGTASSN